MNKFTKIHFRQPGHPKNTETHRLNILAISFVIVVVCIVGARAFVLHHPLAKRVGVAISLDVGGVSGQSFMFRAGHDNAWLIEAYAASARQPVANSLSQEVVNRIGNMATTDLQEFLQREMISLWINLPIDIKPIWM